jgi:hypothetical protein
MEGHTSHLAFIGSSELLTAMRGTESVVDVEDLLHACVASLSYRRGRPKGACNETTIAVETLLDNGAEALTRKVIELALAGNVAALRLCFERLLPPRRDRGVAFDLPKIESAADALAASRAVLERCAAATCR